MTLTIRSLAPAALALGLAATGTLSLSVAGAEDKPSGKDLYKEYCKPCHLKDSKAGEYTPMTLIQDQWKRFFEKKYVRVHENVVDPKHDGKKVLEAITPETLETIRTFTIDHAADSEHPMTCG